MTVGKTQFNVVAKNGLASNKVSEPTALDKARWKVIDEQLADEMLADITKETKRLERLLTVACGFVDRMKIRWLISEDDGTYLNYIYGMLVEGSELDKEEERLTTETNDETDNASIHRAVTFARLSNRMSIYNTLTDIDKDVELVDKTASSTREFYCIDDTKTDTDSTWWTFVQRKVWMAHDVTTGSNELFEIGYDDKTLAADMEDPIENGDVSLHNIHFNVREAA